MYDAICFTRLTWFTEDLIVESANKLPGQVGGGPGQKDDRFLGATRAEPLSLRKVAHKRTWNMRKMILIIEKIVDFSQINLQIF